MNWMLFVVRAPNQIRTRDEFVDRQFSSEAIDTFRRADDVPNPNLNSPAPVLLFFSTGERLR